jgi:sulfatase modifying factor 1
MYIPGGTYLLGSPTSDPAALPHEQPLHKVTLTGFSIYTHEVTNALYQVCVSAGVCLPVSALRSDLADYVDNPAYSVFPVVGVDWTMADAYCRWAGGRLPTESEWEAAARGFNPLLYPWGDAEASCQYAGMLGCGKGDVPFQVGSFANGNSPFKVWDMSGNVWEWVNDWYDANAYTINAAFDPLGPWGGDFKVVRGGGWNSTADNVRAANRLGLDPARSYKDLGFRCVANGFATAATISRPTDSHSGSDYGSRSTDDTELPGSGPVSRRIWHWEAPSTSCAAGRIGILTLPAWNNFGGSYSATIDGTEVSCSYDTASRLLTCHWPLSAPRSGPGSSDYYEATVTLHGPDGNALAGASYTFRIAPGSFGTCTGNSGSGLTAKAGSTCSSAGSVLLTITTSQHMRITGISGDVSIPDPQHNCTVTPDSVTCDIGSGYLGRTINGSLQGTTMDGSIPLTTAFSTTIPATCTGGTSDHPVFTLITSCDQKGLPVFTVSWIPADSVSIDHIVDLTTGRIWSACYANLDGSLTCNIPPNGVDGLAHILIYPARVPTGEALPPQAFSFTAPACSGSTPQQDGFSFRAPVCSPDGSPGVITRVTYTGPGTGVIINVRYAGVQQSCSADGSAPNSFACIIPVPLPADLQFCHELPGSPQVCEPSPYIAMDVPPRCGGSDNADSWSLGLSCGTTVGGYQATVNLTGGRNSASLSAAVGGSSLPCSPDPSMPGTFTCALPGSVQTDPPVFTVQYSDGSEASHSFDNFSSQLPTGCPSSGGNPGGLCSDIASASDWQNPANHYDVNNDGCVSPLDVLTLISEINTGGARTLAEPRPAGSPFVDVNGDGALSAMDVLLVINYLNAHSGAACTPTCTNTPPSGSWSLGTAACIPAGGQVSVNINYPPALTISAFSASDGTAHFTCVDYHTPSHYLACTGPVSTTPGTLVVHYTSGGVASSTSFPEWTTRAPTYCPTPIPPPGTTPHPAVCSDYTDGLICTNASCYWWSSVCHPTQDPCNKYSYTDQNTCTANACTWKDPICSSP